MTKLTDFCLPWPPSVNRLWRSVNGYTLLSATGRAYFKRAFSALPHERVEPHTGRLFVGLFLSAPDARAYDIDNRIKAVFDACTHGKVWLDDKQVDELHVRRAAPSKTHPGVIVTIVEIQ